MVSNSVQESPDPFIVIQKDFFLSYTDPICGVYFLIYFLFHVIVDIVNVLVLWITVRLY